jgi:hypothetical protein
MASDSTVFCGAGGAAAIIARSVSTRGALRGAHPHSCTRRSNVRRETPIIAAMSGTGVLVNS